MRKTKAKRGSFWQRQMLPFAVLWSASIAITGLLARIWQTAPLPFLYSLPEERVALSLITNVILTAAVQVQLVERLLKRSMRRWMWYTSVGLLITLVLNGPLSSSYTGPFTVMGIRIFPLITNLVLNAPIPLLQALWLRKRAKQAWLLPLITIPLLMAFTGIPMGEQDQYRFLKMIMLLSIGIVQGGLMHYLLLHSRDSEKAKIDFAADDQPEHERIQRLQEDESQGTLWDMSDDQARQSEA